MTLKEAITEAGKIYISIPSQTDEVETNYRPKDEFLFKVSKTEVREELEPWLDHDMDEMEYADGVQVNWIFSVTRDFSKKDLRITFG